MRTAHRILIMLCAVAVLSAAAAQIETPPQEMTICSYTQTSVGRNAGIWQKELCSNNITDHFFGNLFEQTFNASTEIISKTFTTWENEEILYLATFFWDSGVQIRFKVGTEYK